MAVRAYDVAAIELEPQHSSPHSAPDEHGDLPPLLPNVIELQDDRVANTAVSTRVAAEMLIDQSLRLLDALRLQGVVTAAMTRAPLGVVPLEARAAPPLAPGGEAVEVGRRPVAGAARTPARRLLRALDGDDRAVASNWRRHDDAARPDAHGRQRNVELPSDVAERPSGSAKLASFFP